jgi:hypothetical protein
MTARAVLDEFIDLKEARRWMADCKKKHEDCAKVLQRTLTFQNHRFRLIDVDSKCIILAGRDHLYAALSYVWGNSKDGRLLLEKKNCPDLLHPGSLARYWSIIPTTIRDAMTATKGMGQRFLWVDSLCLLQDDPEELQVACMLMDKVYQEAEFTIIGAAGDAQTGLPGVFPTKRQHVRLCKDIVPGLQMTTTDGMDNCLRPSVYCQRGWTYVLPFPHTLQANTCSRMQEEVLSWRIYCFVNQIFYRCRMGECGEILNSPGQRIAMDPTYAWASLYPILLDPKDIEFRNFSQVIAYYAQRKFSYETDILRAAQGMLHRYSVLTGKSVLEGLPTPLSQSLLFSPCAIHLVREEQNKLPTKRRLNFPSYSWTGWSDSFAAWPENVETAEVIADRTYGDSKMLKQPVKSTRLDEPKLRAWIVWCTVESGKCFLLDSVGARIPAARPDIKSALSQCPLEFKNIPIVDTENGLSTFGAQKPYTLLRFWTVCINLAFKPGLGLVNNFGWVCGKVEFDTNDFDKSLPLKLALIARIDDTFMALILKWNEDGLAERWGVATLDHAILNNSLEPGPRWKEIILG